MFDCDRCGILSLWTSTSETKLLWFLSCPLLFNQEETTNINSDCLMISPCCRPENKEELTIYDEVKPKVPPATEPGELENLFSILCWLHQLSWINHAEKNKNLHLIIVIYYYLTRN